MIIHIPDDLGGVMFDNQDTFRLATMDEWIAANIKSGHAQAEYARLVEEAKESLSWWVENALNFRRLRDAGG